MDVNFMLFNSKPFAQFDNFISAGTGANLNSNVTLVTDNTTLNVSNSVNPIIIENYDPNRIYTLGPANQNDTKLIILDNLSSIAKIDTGTQIYTLDKYNQKIQLYYDNNAWTDFSTLYTPTFVTQEKGKFVGQSLGNVTVNQGYSVSLYESTLAVGGPLDNDNIGAVWIFDRSGTGWTQTVKLTSTDTVGPAQLGYSVSLNQTTLAVGGPQDSTGIGGVWIYNLTSTGWIEHTKLVGSVVDGYANQGYSVSLYNDSLAVGGPLDSNGTGATWIYTRSGGVWSELIKLVGKGGVTASTQGTSTSIYGDIVAIGSPLENSNTGKTWIFNRSGSIWYQETGIEGTGSIGSSEQGYNVHLNSDTLAIGGPGDDSDTGAVWMYRRTSPGVWSSEGKLVCSSSTGSRAGSSVSVYGDRLAIGGPEHDSGVGSVWLFERSGGVWTEVKRLVGIKTLSVSEQGWSTSIYGDTLAIGGISDNSSVGLTWMFRKVNGEWVQEARLLGTGYVGPAQQGYSVSVYEDTVAIGAPSDNNNKGATWIFNWNGSNWIQQGSKLVGSDGTTADRQGTSVSLNGNTLAIGGPSSYDEIGRTWVYVRNDVNSPWVQQAILLGSKNLLTSSQGVSISINGTILAIGGINVTWMFEYTTGWERTAKLIGENSLSSDQGYSVSVYGTSVAIGGPSDNFNRGAVWVFKRVDALNWTSQGKITPPADAIVNIGDGPRFGSSVSLYSDTLAIGGPEDDSGIGAVWIYKRVGGLWSKYVKLIGFKSTEILAEGFSVSLYNDTVAIGVPGKEGNKGCVYIYTRTGESWFKQTKLEASVSIGARFGESVSLYNNTLVVGAPYNNSGVGSAYVFTRTGSFWSIATVLSISTNVGQSNIGKSVSVYGNSIVVGGPEDDSGIGATWVFNLVGSVWVYKAKIVGFINNETAAQGFSSSIYDDTLVLGAPYDGSGVGALWVFDRVGEVWTQTTKLHGIGNTGPAMLGSSVSIYNDKIAAGGPKDNNSIGAVWTYQKTGSSWIQIGNKLVGSGYTGASEQGTSVSLYGDILMWGGPYDHNNDGKVWVYSYSSPNWIEKYNITNARNFYVNSGNSVSVYNDTLAIGEPNYNNTNGSVRIYTRILNNWEQQAHLKAASTGFVKYGSSVSLYSDTVAIGAPMSNGGVGSVWVYTRSGGVWNYQQEISPIGNNGNANHGHSLSLYENTLAVGGPMDDGENGAVWMYSRNGSVWTHVIKIKANTAYIGNSRFGFSVSLYDNVVAIGAPYDDTYTGAVWKSAKLSSGLWETGLGNNDKKTFGNFQYGFAGYSVDIDSLGTSMVVGAPGEGIGAAWVCTRSNTGAQWNLTTTSIDVIDPNVYYYGYNVKMTGPNRIAIGSAGNQGLEYYTVDGAIRQADDVGACWIYEKSGGVWSLTDKVVGPGYTGTIIGQGTSVDIYDKTLIVGGPGDSDRVGGTWVFTSKTGATPYTGYSGATGNTGYTGYTGYLYEYTGYTNYTGYYLYTGYHSEHVTFSYSGYTGYLDQVSYSGYTGYGGYTGYTGYSGYLSIPVSHNFTGYINYTGFTDYTISNILYTGYVNYTGYYLYTGYHSIGGYTSYMGYSGYHDSTGYYYQTSYSGYTGYTGYSGYLSVNISHNFTGYINYTGFTDYTISNILYTGYVNYTGYYLYTGYNSTGGYTGYTGTTGYHDPTGYYYQVSYSGYTGYTVSTGYILLPEDYNYTGYFNYTGFTDYTISNILYTGYVNYTGYYLYTGYDTIGGYTSYTGNTGYQDPTGYYYQTSYSGYTGYTISTGYTTPAEPYNFTGYFNYTGFTDYTISNILYTGYVNYTGYTSYTGNTGYQDPTGYYYQTSYSGYTGYTISTGYTTPIVPYNFTGYYNYTGYRNYTSSQIIAGFTGMTGYTLFYTYTGPYNQFWTYETVLRGEKTKSEYGSSLSLYGNTVAIGSPADNTNIGAAWIMKTANNWVTYGEEAYLVGPNNIGASRQGTSVSLYDDSLVVGGPYDNNSTGAIWLYTRSDPIWTYVDKKIGSNATGSAFQGSSVSIYGNFNTNSVIAVGGRENYNGLGAVWIYNMNVGVTEITKLSYTGILGNTGYIGSSVSIFGDTLISGGYRDNSNVGAVWTTDYVSGVWTQRSKLIGHNTLPQSKQGTSVSIYGDTVAIGSPLDNSGTGSTWIYRDKSIWLNEGYLVGTSGTSQGSSVSLYSDTVAVGSPLDNSGTGATFIFTRTGNVWSQQGSKIVVPGGQLQGSSVSVYGDKVLIGSPGTTSGTGASYVYNRVINTWVFADTLLGSTNTSGSHQGSSVSLYNNYAAIGATGDYSGIGTTYIYKYDSPIWSQTDKITALDQQYPSNQGYSTSLYASHLAIGGPEYASGTGTTWIFQNDANDLWIQTNDLIASGSTGSNQGYSVSVSGSTLAIGGPYVRNINNTGAAWIYRKVGDFWSEQARFVSPDSGGSNYGYSVSTYEGASYSSLIVGDPVCNRNLGCVYIYTGSSTGWSTYNHVSVENDSEVGEGLFGSSVSIYFQNAGAGAPADYNDKGAAWVFENTDNYTTHIKLVGAEYTGAANQGYSVSLDNNLLAIGSPLDDSNEGTVYIFERVGSIWTQQAFIFSLDNILRAQQGYSVSIYGNRLAYGGPFDNSGVGASWIYERDDLNIWTEKIKIVAPNSYGASNQGWSVSLEDGRVAIGGPGDLAGTGATWIYSGTGASWTQQTKLIGVGNIGDASQGYSVSLYQNELAVGGPTDYGNKGATWVFDYTGSSWVQKSKLLGSDEATLSNQGTSVSLYGDSIAIGGPSEDTNYGAVYVFNKLGTTWFQQAYLTTIGNIGAPYLGASVFLNDTILAVGGPEDNGGIGAVWIYTKDSTIWSQEAKLIGSNEIGNGRQGSSVSMYGNILVFGSPHDDSGKGAIWIFERVSNLWSEVEKVVPIGMIGSSRSGSSVSIYDSSISIGSPYDYDNKGATYVYTYNTPNWEYQAKLVGSDYIGGGRQGSSVSIYDDSVAIGAPKDNSDVGSTYVYNVISSNWLQQANIVASNSINAAKQGSSVSLYADNLAVGGPEDDSGIGAAWVYNRSNSIWTQTSKLIGSQYTGASIYQGTSVSLHEDTLAVGGPGDTNGTGAAWVYKDISNTWVQQYKLSGSLSSSSNFGRSVSTFDTYTAIGGPEYADGYGSTWVYLNNTEQAKLLGVGNNNRSDQGTSIALYDDIMVIGGYTDNDNKGAAWVFRKIDGEWYEEVKLIGTNDTGNAQQGFSVAVYGTTIVVGGPDDNSGTGAVWVYDYNGSSWTQTTKLVGSSSLNSQFGYSVSIYNDTIAVGGPEYNSGVGACWIFKRILGVWSEYDVLVGSLPLDISNRGTSVSLYENTVAVGGPEYNSAIGGVWVFVEVGGVWSQQDIIISASTIGPAYQGNTVSLFGETLIIGGLFDDSNTGAVWVYDRVGGVWVQNVKLVGSTTSMYAGYSLSIFGDVLAYGEPGYSFGIGSVVVYTRENNVWTRKTSLTGLNYIGGSQQGSSVSIYGDGIAIGGPYDNSNVGAGWMFTYYTR